MHKLSVLLWIAISSFASTSARAEPQVAPCPDSSVGEIQEDCPWAGIARSPDFSAALKEAAPELAMQIAHDSHEGEYKALWGESINFDELAKGIIVDPAILKTLAKTFKVHFISDRLSHAGMEHTYGYLFSTLKTAFGYKRARWVHGDTDRGFGFAIGTLGPEAPKASGGTLFSNATYFFGQIAFRNDPELLRVLKEHSHGVSESLKRFDYSALKPIRLEEIIASKGVTLRTDLVPFTIKPEGADAGVNTYLLVYSVVVHGQARLITGFPVGQSFVDSTLDKSGLGENKPIITRYNGFVSGVSGETFSGTRKVSP